MQQSIEQRSNIEGDVNVLHRNIADKKMMARITNEQKQRLQSRLLKRTRGLITIADDGEESDMNWARSLKGGGSNSDDEKKEDKSEAKPLKISPAKEYPKEEDSKVEKNSPGSKLAHPSPANAPPKEKGTNQKDTAGGDSHGASTAESKLSESKVAHPSPANAPSKEVVTKQKDKTDAESYRPKSTTENPSSETKPVNPSPANVPSTDDDKNQTDKSDNDNEKIQPVTPPSGSKGKDSSEKSSSRTSTESSSSQSSFSSSSHGRSSKSSKGGTCDKRLTTAFKQIRALPDDFGVVSTPAEITAACAFNPTRDFNLGCPFVYDPTANGFVDSEEMYQIWFENNAVGSAYWSFVLYCQCHQAFELNCAAKVPHGPPSSTVMYGEEGRFVNSYSEFIPASTPEKRLDYCQMAGVWNGDFYTGLARELSSEIRDCGCYFVGTAKDMIGACPGVDLGAFSPFFTIVGDDGDSAIVSEILMMENGTYYPTMSPSDE